MEDDELVARLIRDLLEGVGFDVATASSAAAARAVLRDFDPDVVLIDLMLADGLSGADLAHVTVAEHPGVAVLVLTRFPDLASAGLAANALPPTVGFVRKDRVEDAAYLVHAIDEVVDGRAAGQRHDRDPHRPPAVLTTAQHDVLRLIALGYGNAAIASQRDCRLSSVEKLISEIYRRLGLEPGSGINPRVEAARLFVSVAGLPERQ